MNELTNVLLTISLEKQQKEFAGQVLGLAQWVRTAENPSQEEWKLARELAEAICQICKGIIEK